MPAEWEYGLVGGRLVVQVFTAFGPVVASDAEARTLRLCAKNQDLRAERQIIDVVTDRAERAWRQDRRDLDRKSA